MTLRCCLAVPSPFHVGYCVFIAPCGHDCYFVVKGEVTTMLGKFTSSDIDTGEDRIKKSAGAKNTSYEQEMLTTKLWKMG